MKMIKTFSVVMALSMTLTLFPATAFGKMSTQHPYNQRRANGISSASDWAVEGIRRSYDKGFIPPDLLAKYSLCTYFTTEMKNNLNLSTYSNNFTSPLKRSAFARLAVCFVEYAMAKSIAEVIAERGLSVNYEAFSDTTDPYILAAYTLGIVSGTTSPTAGSKGIFSPDGHVTREQAAVMLRNTCGVVGLDVSNTVGAGFADIGQASGWAVDAINFVKNTGIMGGTSGASLVFSPKDKYTQEQSLVTFGNIELGYEPVEYFPIQYGGLKYELDEALVLERIMAYKDIYPHGTPITDYPEIQYASYGNGSYTECAAFALIVQYNVFGWLYYFFEYSPTYADNIDYEKIRIGDVLEILYGLPQHRAIIIGIEGSKVTLAEANYEGKMNWGRVIDLDELNKKDIGFRILSCYPK